MPAMNASRFTSLEGCQARGVDDVVAASFVVTWKKFAVVESPSLPWLFRIASYEVANHRRTARRFQGNVTLKLVGDLPILRDTDEIT